MVLIQIKVEIRKNDHDNVFNKVDMNILKKLSSLFLLFIAIGMYGQTGINITEVNPRAELHIEAPNYDKGFLIPRLTLAQRDAIPVSNAEDGLTIFNTTDNCVNYWNVLENKWKSLCGLVGKAEFSIQNCTNIQVNGQYMSQVPVTNSNYIMVTINVTKAGKYSIIATTTPDNGFYFSKSEDYIGVGTVTLKIPAMGTPSIPSLPGKNIFGFSLNGLVSPSGCTFSVEVENSAVKPNFAMSCNSISVEGVYKFDQQLTTSNQIKVSIDADADAVGATYFLYTDEVDGIQFKAQGKLVAGNQVVTLLGQGTPSTSATKRMRIMSNSSKTLGVCYANVRIVASSKKILVVGGSSTETYSFANPNSAVRKMLGDTRNYGSLPLSKVAFDSWSSIYDGGQSPNLQSLLFGSTKYDILIVENNITLSDTQLNNIVEYMQKDGVVLMFSDNNDNIIKIMKSLTGSSLITSDKVNVAGSLYRLSNVNDMVVNGPFGDIRSKAWGEDGSQTARVLEIPTSDFVVYSDATNISVPPPVIVDPDPIVGEPEPGKPGSETGNNGTVGYTALKHIGYHFVWIGDSGFNNSNGGDTSNIKLPFKIDGNNFPISKSNYGNQDKKDVYNSVFTANLIAWAIERSEMKGFNKK